MGGCSVGEIQWGEEGMMEMVGGRTGKQNGDGLMLAVGFEGRHYLL